MECVYVQVTCGGRAKLGQEPRTGVAVYNYTHHSGGGTTQAPCWARLDRAAQIVREPYLNHPTSVAITNGSEKFHPMRNILRS